MQANLPLKIFQSLTLQYQDDAYTLAYYLFGDEARAAEAVQAAFTRVGWRKGISSGQFRVEVFRHILTYIRSSTLIGSMPVSQDDLSRKLITLKQEERSALVLVDVLGMEYAEARQVLGVSQKYLGKLVAQGRVDLSRQMSPA